ncbi:MAG: AAA family ATPase, partial [Planctomycetota bacterium]
MSLLQQVQRGKAHLPPRILVYGTEGVGKSSLAATTPRPIFIQTEDGLGEIDCDRFP